MKEKARVPGRPGEQRGGQPGERPGEQRGEQPGEQPGEPAEWPSEWLRGALEVCVLRILAEGPTYGYAISARLAHEGLGTVKGGTLYPLLGRFERAGLVRVEWRTGETGPARKYYALTAAGRAELAVLAERWAAFAALTSRFVTPSAAADPERPAAASPRESTP
jgi:PadR family transcriptional regulator PadR